MSSVTSNLSDILSNNSPYTVSAKMSGGVLDSSTSVINGKQTSDLFKASKEELGKMDFLKLLTTQLQYQDPLKPMDNTEFVAQLAQFSALEGTTNVADSVDKLSDSFNDSLEVQNFNAKSMTNSSAVSLIGKDVMLRQTELYNTGESTNIRVQLGNNSSAVVKILDDDGNIVATLNAGNKDADNASTVTWDGKSDNGEDVPLGKYHLYIDGQENDSSLYCFVQDHVEGIRYTSEGPLIKVGGKEIPVGNILDISETGSSGTSGSGGLGFGTAVSLIGKDVSYKQDSITFSPANGQTIELNAYLGGYKNGSARILDSNGNVVRSIDLNAASGSNATATIDCLDYNGNGPYTVKLSPTTPGYLFSKGKVDGVSTVDGSTKLKVNGVKLSLSDIFDVSV